MVSPPVRSLIRVWVFLLSLILLLNLESAASPILAQSESPIIFSKAFSPQTIGPGSVSTLTFTMTNSDSVTPSSDMAFTDNLPADMTIADPSNASTTCTAGIVTAPVGGSAISFSNGQLETSATCYVTVNVTASKAASYENISGELTSSSGNSGTATATLTVSNARPGFSKIFAPNPIALGGTSTLTFTIDNTLNSTSLSSLNFSDFFPTGMLVATPANATTTCLGANLTATPGASSITHTGGTVNNGATCTITVDVTTSYAGLFGNISGSLSSSAGEGGKASDTLDVRRDFLIKTFTNDPAPPGGTVDLEFLITNFDRGNSATNINFTDDLDATLSGLTVFGSLPTIPCGAGSQLTGSTVLSLTGGSLPPEGSCNFTVTLQVPPAAASGTYPNTTSSVTANVGGIGVTENPATDEFVVAPLPILTKTFLSDPVISGDSVVLEFEITNSSSVSSATGITFFDDLTLFIPGTVTTNLPQSDVCGAGSVLSGSTFVSLTGGNLAANATCTFSVILQLPADVPPGTYLNTVSNLTAQVESQTLTARSATDSLSVVTAPTLNKVFADDPVTPGETVILAFTLEQNDNSPGPATDITFTDDLDAVLSGLTAVGLPQNDVCGTGSQLSGTSVLTLSSGNLDISAACTFSVTLQIPPAAAPGSYTNTTSNLSATVGGLAVTEAAATDTLDIRGLSVAKSFLDDPVIAGSSVTLAFTLTNESLTENTTDITFTDDLDAVLSGLTAVGLPKNDVCGSGSQLSGTSVINLSGGNLAVSSSCIFSVTLTTPVDALPGNYLNTTSSILATVGGLAITEAPVTDTLSIGGFSASKLFLDDPVVPGSAVTLAFSLTNLSVTESITDISFTDDLDAVLSGLTAVNLPQNDVCGSGSQLSGSTFLTFNGGNLAANSSCTFTVTLQIPVTTAAGEYLNTTNQIGADLSGNLITISPATDAFVVTDLLILDKHFLDNSTFAGNPVTLAFTLTNASPITEATNLTFTDDLDTVLTGLAATGLPVADVCGSGSQLNGTAILTLSGGHLGANSSCAFSVTLQIPAAASSGIYTNTTSQPIGTVSSQTVTGKSGSDDLTLVETGTIIVDKVTNPVGDPTNFDFTLSGGPSALDLSFSLTDGAAPQTQVVEAGPGYSIAESTPTGWTLTSAGCDDGSLVTNIDVGADEIVTCTFTNFAPFTSEADPAIHKSVTPATAFPGQMVAYSLVFSNAGTTTATNVILSDAVPINLTNTSVISSGGVITQTSPGYIWSIQDLAPGQIGFITVTGQISSSLLVETILNTAVITGANDTDSTNNISSASLVVSSEMVHLPLIFKNTILAPDLVINSLVAAGNQITLTIKNNGHAPVVDAFWVQISIDPATPPTDVNQRWDTLGNKQGGTAQGALWGVVSPGVPLPPNGVLTLTLDDLYYYQGSPNNNVPNPIAEGTIIYAQVDAINFDTDYGNVIELNEDNNIITTTALGGQSIIRPIVDQPIHHEPSTSSLPALED